MYDREDNLPAGLWSERLYLGPVVRMMKFRTLRLIIHIPVWGDRGICMEWLNVHTGVWLVFAEWIDIPMPVESWFVTGAGVPVRRVRQCAPESRYRCVCGTPVSLHAGRERSRFQPPGRRRNRRTCRSVHERCRKHHECNADQNFPCVHQCSLLFSGWVGDTRNAFVHHLPDTLAAWLINTPNPRGCYV